MAEVILFHHALGVTDGVRAFADQLSDGGHQVTVADLFGGATFDSTEEGVAFEEQLGWDEVIARSDILIVATPHAVYRELDLTGKIVIDIWNLYGKGAYF